MSILQYLLFSGASILEFKHTVYNGFHIYAVKRANANMTMFSGLYDNEALPSWWCGYVCLTPEITNASRERTTKRCHPGFGFSYDSRGIPGVINDGDCIGWDYNSICFIEEYGGTPIDSSMVFYEGMKVIDFLYEAL